MPEHSPEAATGGFCGLLACGCFLCGTLFNLISCRLFLRKLDEKIIRQLFKWLLLFDILTSILILFIGLPLVHTSPGLKLLDNPMICNIWAFSWNVSIRMTGYIMALISLSQAVHCIFKMNIYYSARFCNIIKSIITVIFVLELIKDTIPIWSGGRYSYSKQLMICDYFFPDLFSTYNVGYKAYKILYVFHLFEVMLPTIMCSLSALIIICSILYQPKIKIQSKSTQGSRSMTRNLRSRTKSLEKNELFEKQKKDTKSKSTTVLIITVIYILWSFPACFYELWKYLFSFDSITDDTDLTRPSYILIFSLVFSKAFNSALNPFVYCMRYIRRGPLFFVQRRPYYSMSPLSCVQEEPSPLITPVVTSMPFKYVTVDLQPDAVSVVAESTLDTVTVDEEKCMTEVLKMEEYAESYPSTIDSDLLEVELEEALSVQGEMYNNCEVVYN